MPKTCAAINWLILDTVARSVDVRVMCYPQQQQGVLGSLHKKVPQSRRSPTPRRPNRTQSHRGGSRFAMGSLVLVGSWKGESFRSPAEVCE